MEENTNFEAVLRKLDSDHKGKGHAFEVAAKWWLQNDPDWASFFEPESVKLWTDSELADGPDIGIDITARDYFGRNWAVQVKNWRPEKPLPKAEIDKFLTASNTKRFFGRVLLTTTKEISRNARKALADQEKECIVVSYDALAKSDVWDAFLGQENSQERKPKQVTLFPHQREAVQAVTKGLKSGAMRAQLLMACGTGKTITAQKISESLNSRITVFLAPSLLLIQQSRTSWLNHYGTQPSPLALAVCSDDTVAQDEFSSSVLDLPFHVTTNAVEIESFLRLQGSKVIFSTYQSFASLEEGLQRSGVEPDLVIFDEAHKLAGSKGKKFSASLRSKVLANSRHLFMTATPKVFRGTKTAEGQFEEQVFSMDDPETFGEVLFDYSFSRAIEEKRLSRYEVVIMPVTDSEVRCKIDNRTLLRLGDTELDAEMLAVHIGLEKAMELFNISRVISFHSSIQRARDFADFHPQVTSTLGPVRGREPTSSTVLTGSDSVRKRKQVLDDLASTLSSQFKLVTNARCLTEGVDVPSLDGIAFIDPKTSQTDIVQAVGRAIRRGKANKEVGYIVLPVFVSQESLELGEIESQRFSHVVSVLNALRSHDANLVVSFGKLRYALGRHGALSKLPTGVELCASEDIPADFFEKIQAYLVRSSSPSFEEHLGMLKSYVDRHGHAQIPSVDQTPEEERIYRWITSQRTAYRNGLLSEERISKLSAVQGWSWDPFEESWESGLAALKKHFDSGGKATVPRGFEIDGVNLFNFIRLHRNKSERLTEERRAQLDALPQWSWSPFGEAWESRFRQLEFALRDSGELALDALPESDRKPLLEWIGYQRKHKDTRLESEQVERLESLPGWRWKVEKWEDNFNLLTTYTEKFGTSNVPSSKIFQGKRLGAWVSSQRSLYNAGKLSDNRKLMLQSLEGWLWNPIEIGWEGRLETLKRYLDSNSFEEISSKTQFEGWGLGEWVLKLRRSESTLSEKQRRELSEIPGWSFGTKFDLEFEHNFAVLAKYVERFGTSVAPSNFIFEGVNLAAWVRNRKNSMENLSSGQRAKLEKLPDWESGEVSRERLTKKQLAELAKLPFKKRNVSKEAWDENSQKVLEYLEEHDVKSISKRATHDGVEIGAWLYGLKGQKDKLTEKQVSWLERLPGWTWEGRDGAWVLKFELLKEYFEEFGTTRVPQGRIYADVQLGTWVSRQRQQKSKMNPSRIQALESLPDWSWDPQEDDWERKFRVFADNPDVNFFSREGRELIIDGVSVGSWCRTQQSNWPTLDEEKRNRLRKCPHWREPE